MLNTLLCLLLTTGTGAPLPEHLWQTEEPLQEELTQPEEEPGKLKVGDILVTWGVGVSTMNIEFDDDLHLEETDGIYAELIMRLDRAYFYYLGGSIMTTDTEGLPVADEVDYWSAVVGLGMDMLFGAFAFAHLDVSAGIGLQGYDGAGDSDTGWFYQFSVVARVRPIDLVAAHIGFTWDYLHTDWRQVEHDTYLNITWYAGLEILY